MESTPSSAAGLRPTLPLQAPQLHRSGSGAPPPRPRVDIRADIRDSFLELDDRNSSSGFSKKVASLLATQQQANATLSRLLIGIDEDRDIDPRTRIDFGAMLVRQTYIMPMFELRPELLASCLVALEPGTEGTDPALNASNASTATTSDQPGANRDNSAV